MAEALTQTLKINSVHFHKEKCCAAWNETGLFGGAKETEREAARTWCPSVVVAVRDGNG